MKRSLVAALLVCAPGPVAAEPRAELGFGINGGVMTGDPAIAYGGYHVAIGPRFGRLAVVAEYMLVWFSGEHERGGRGHRLGVAARFDVLRVDVGPERLSVFAIAGAARAWNRSTTGVERRAGLGLLISNEHAGFGFDATAAVTPDVAATCTACKRATTPAAVDAHAIVARMFWTFHW
jgi:hypothetical protein